MGTKAIKTDRRMDGKRPVMTPRITGGMSLMKLRNETPVLHEYFLTVPFSDGLTVCQVVDVTDCTYNSNWNSPENDHQYDEGRGPDLPQHPLPLANLQITPDDLARRDRNGSGINFRRLPWRHPPVCCFRRLLAVKFNKNGWQEFPVKTPMLLLVLLNLRD